MDEGTQHFGSPASVVHKNVFSDFITAQTKVWNPSFALP
jgi:hypothetical protein